MEKKSLKQAMLKASENKEEAASQMGLASDLFAGIKVQGSERDKDKVEWLLERLNQSEAGKELVDNISKEGYTFIFQPSSNAAGSCMVEKKLVTLNPRVDEDRLVATLSHELRHALQFSRGSNHQISTQTTKTKIMTTRAMEADANAFAALSCWQLKESKHEGPWGQVGDPKPWQKLSETAPLITSAFEEEMNKSGNENKAMSAAFKAWYHDKVREGYDKGHVENLQHIESLGLAGRLSFANEKSAEEIASTTCSHKGVIYVENVGALLNSPEYLSISEDTMNGIKAFFDKREQVSGMKVDSSLSKIPVKDSDGKIKQPVVNQALLAAKLKQGR